MASVTNVPLVSQQVFSSAFLALGYQPDVERLYWDVLRLSGERLGSAAASLFRTPEQLRADLGPLLRHGVVQVDGDVLTVAPPPLALTQLVRRQAAATADAARRLEELAQVIPRIYGGQAGGAGGGEAEIHEGDVVELCARWLAESSGDLLWLRPDQWSLDHEPDLVDLVRQATAQGRRSRAIYPARVLTDAPDVLRARIGAGEQVRLAATVPTRMLVMGETHALVPDVSDLGVRRLVVRQTGVVRMLVTLFEELWSGAVATPDGRARPDVRRMILQQLAAGESDERIARTLGISLRTVRRRIASLLIELGVDTRFQAGVEAVRRGWL